MSSWYDKDDIKEQCPIEAVIDSHCGPLYNYGPKRMKCLCPFHEDNKPSLIIFLHTETWYCFGCSRGGDVITFIMELEGLEFKDACEYLMNWTTIS